MSKVNHIKKGLEIKLVGDAEKTIQEVQATQYAIKPTDFIGLFPKLMVKEGDKVQAGSPIFFDKYRDDIVFTSPVSGEISQIYRGAKRKILEIRITSDGKHEAVDFGKADPNSMDKAAITEKLLKSGLWTLIRQRPFSTIAEPKDTPKLILVSGFDNAPLGPDYDFILQQQGEAFQTGLDALAKLSEGKVHLNLHHKLSQSPVLTQSKQVQVNTFSGKYPSCMPGPQLSLTSPMNKGEVVWVVNPQDVVTIGQLFLEGIFDSKKIVALTGSEVKKPLYLSTRYGVSMADILKNHALKTEDTRIISGNALTGTHISADSYLGFYHSHITVLPEGKHTRFMGWITPNTDLFSYYKAMFSWFKPSKKYRLTTNMNGGERAFVVTGKFEQVFPFDIYPMYLIKAVMAKDIDQMEKLGIYEVEAEDFALLEFISTSKIEIQSIVAEGLEYLRKELS